MDLAPASSSARRRCSVPEVRTLRDRERTVAAPEMAEHKKSKTGHNPDLLNINLAWRHAVKN